MTTKNYHILKATIQITKENREKVLNLPGISDFYRVGDEVVFHYSIHSDIDLNLASCDKKEFQALLWALTNYPTQVNEIEFEQLESQMRQIRQQMRKTMKRLKKILKAITASRKLNQ